MEFAGGIHLCGTPLWFDAPQPVDLCFVSRAVVAPFPAHRRILTTERTVKLLGQVPSSTLICPYHRPFALGSLEIELFPAGTIPGSSQIRVRTAAGDLVFAGDVNHTADGLAERGEVVPCDVLVFQPSTAPAAGPPPRRDKLRRTLLTFVQRAMRVSATPVVLAGELGEAQEVIRLLQSEDHVCRVHQVIYDWCKRYREIGIELPNVRRFRGTPKKGEIAVFPLRLRSSRAITGLKRVRTIATVSAKTDDIPGKSGPSIDETLPLGVSNRLADIVRYIEIAKPSKVYLGGPHAPALGHELLAQGIAAQTLAPPLQMGLFRDVP